ncbi:C2H2-type zinc finger protein [Candidatus Sororendozoicomonas aggregata]|uniref:C2H2-type zinc finger protein n=1 Tax=Candidatus Sororendozoicomonas aggregata TaxID=3073239 RepID=UPI002ECFB9F4
MPKVYYCDECGRKCLSPSKLREHERTHSGEKPFNCKVCKKSFTQGSSLLIHMRTHTGEKPFSCEICGKGFVSSSSMKTHRRIHSDEKPFVCHCGKSFTTNVYLKQHQRAHDRGGGFRFDCPVCDSKWFRLERLYCQHMQTEHPDYPNPESAINRQSLPGIGAVSSVTHELRSEVTDEFTSVSRIASDAGTATLTSRNTPAGTIFTVSQPSGPCFSLAQPLSADNTAAVSVDYGELLGPELREFSAWQDKDPEF